MKSHWVDWFDKHFDCFRIIILDILIWMIQFNKTLSQNIWIKTIALFEFYVNGNEQESEWIEKNMYVDLKGIVFDCWEREKRRMRIVI